MRVTPQFAGTLRVRRLAIADFTNRSSEIFNVGNTPVGMSAGAQAAVTFTVDTTGAGTYMVEIVGDAGATGAYSVTVTSR